MALATDLRNAARSLFRTPTIAVSAIVCIGLGIGATVAVSSAISRALLQPLPFDHAERLVAVHRETPTSGPKATWPLSVGNYLDLAGATRQLSGLAALFRGSALVETPAGGVTTPEIYVTGNFFSVLGAHAERGRLLSPSDDDLAQPQVAVISDELWHSKFAARADIVGQQVVIDGQPTAIVGILPPDFSVPHGFNVFRADVWETARFTPQQRIQRRSNFLSLVGRLAPGATETVAGSEMQAIFKNLVRQYPKLRGENVWLAPLRSDSQRGVRTPLLLLFGAVCLVLLIAATNVAALLLARGVQRRRELAVRNALGASRWAAMRPSMFESFIIAILGTLVGLGLGLGGVRTIGVLSAARLPQLSGLHLDGRVFAFAVVLCAITAVVCGIVPAWRGASVNPQDALRGGRGGGAGREQHRALRTLVTIEIALSLVLLIGAGLVLNSFRELVNTDPGFEVAHAVTMTVTVPAANYQNGDGIRRFLEPALASIRAIPGVEAAGAINLVPYVGWGNNNNTRYEGDPPADPSSFPTVEQRVIDPDFFTATKQRLLAGRVLNAGDDERPNAPPVVVVNKALVDRDFKGKNPVGHRFYITDTSFATIVGVVSDIKNGGPFQKPIPEMYWTYRQASLTSVNFPFLIRTKSADATSVIKAVRSAILAVAPLAAVGESHTMPEMIAKSLGGPRFYVSMLGSFAVVALVLALSGLFGVLAYSVALRTRELGIRAALGSTQQRLVRLMLTDGARLVGLGLLFGYVAAYGVTKLMTSILFGASPLAPSVWVSAGLALAVTAAVAVLIPARRAAAADPLLAIRAE